MKAKTELTFHQKLAGILLKDQTAFMRWFWKEDLSLPPSTRQKTFWNDESDQVCAATGRKTAKTISLEALVFRTALKYRGAQRVEAALGTPGDNQRRFIWDRVTQKVDRTPLFRMLFDYSKNESKIVCNNFTWYFRIDGSDGTDKNWVGLRLVLIVFDEAQLTNHVCHDSRRQSALPGCKWRYFGVPNGQRGTPFYELDQSDEGATWSRHKFSTYVNPIYWNEEQKTKLQHDYRKSPQGYVTQVMGGWGEEVFSSFPPEALAIDDRMPYRIVTLRGDEIPLRFDMVSVAQMQARLRLPRVKNLYRYVLGGDIGVFQDPTEIIIAYCTKPPTRIDGNGPKIKDSDWRCLARISLTRADTQAQERLIRIIAFILGENRLAKVAIDKMGAGVSIITGLLQAENYPFAYWMKRLIQFTAGATLEVVPRPIDLDKLGEEAQPYHWRDPERKGQKVREKEWFTKQLQAALISAKNDLTADFRLWLGSDEDLLQELIATRERKTESGETRYIPPTEGHHRLPQDHRTDALRCVVSAALAYINEPDDDEEDDLGDVAVWADEPMFGAAKTGQGAPPWVPRQPAQQFGVR